MAIKKEYELDYVDIKVEYWKIGKIEVNTIAKLIEITLFGWRSEQERKENKPPIEKKKIVLSDEEYNNIVDNSKIIDISYNNIKNKKIMIEDMLIMDLTNSEDC